MEKIVESISRGEPGDSSGNVQQAVNLIGQPQPERHSVAVKEATKG